MSAKQNTALKVPAGPYCQHVNAKGRRCYMLVDRSHRLSNGEHRPPLCAYHANRLKAATPLPDPETLAAELLGSIEDFGTADAVNMFLGNLLKQLARKRIARRDALAMAYVSQLLLNSLPALRRENEDEMDAAAGHELLEAMDRFSAESASSQSHEPSANQPIPMRRP